MGMTMPTAGKGSADRGEHSLSTAKTGKGERLLKTRRGRLSRDPTKLAVATGLQVWRLQVISTQFSSLEWVQQAAWVSEEPSAR